MTKGRVAAAAIVVVVAVIALGALTSGDDTDPDVAAVEPPVAPGQWSHPQWEIILGGDQGDDPARWADLDAFSDLDDPDGIEAAAGELVVSQMTEPVPDDVDALNPDIALMGTCSGVETVATSAAKLPDTDVLPGASWAKILVAWRGECAGAGETDGGDVHLSSVYGRNTGGGWELVEERHVPGSGARWLASEPSLDLVEVGCGGDGRLDATVAAAWDTLCTDAAADGVQMRISSSFRDPDAQLDLWDTASSEVGADTARRWVIEPGPDGACRSRHCDGAAIDVSGDGALQWLNTVARCQTDSGFVDPVDGSCAGAVEVPRHLLYGFLAPYPHIPNHLEWGQPLLESRWVGCGPTSGETGSRIAAVWRCRLAHAGVPAHDIVTSAAGAVAASRCASGWNPAAEASGGLYRNVADPRTGEPDTRRGLFMFDEETNRRWVKDPTDLDSTVAGAADKWLAQRHTGDPWAGFGCSDTAAAAPGWAQQY